MHFVDVGKCNLNVFKFKAATLNLLSLMNRRDLSSAHYHHNSNRHQRVSKVHVAEKLLKNFL